MKKLNITKERFEKSRYFQKKYGTLEYVSESRKVFKTNKGKVLMFKESLETGMGTRKPRLLHNIDDEVTLDSYYYDHSDESLYDLPETGWIVDDIRWDERGKTWEYHIVNDNLPPEYREYANQWVFEIELEDK